MPALRLPVESGASAFTRLGWGYSLLTLYASFGAFAWLARRDPWPLVLFLMPGGMVLVATYAFLVKRRAPVDLVIDGGEAHLDDASNPQPGRGFELRGAQSIAPRLEALGEIDGPLPLIAKAALALSPEEAQAPSARGGYRSASGSGSEGQAGGARLDEVVPGGNARQAEHCRRRARKVAWAPVAAAAVAGAPLAFWRLLDLPATLLLIASALAGVWAVVLAFGARADRRAKAGLDALAAVLGPVSPEGEREALALASRQARRARVRSAVRWALLVAWAASGAALLYRGRDRWGCRQGDARACVRAAGALDPSDDMELALDLFERACSRSYADGCEGGALLLEPYGLYDGPKASFNERACSLGRPESCNRLGIATRKGEGTARDPGRARALFSSACEAGSMAACTNLGAMLEGEGATAADKARARELYARACEARFGDGCNNLGAESVGADDAQAAALYERACSYGSGLGCKNLAALVGQGRGVARDEARAKELKKKACSLGEYSSCPRWGRGGRPLE